MAKIMATNRATHSGKKLIDGYKWKKVEDGLYVKEAIIPAGKVQRQPKIYLHISEK